MLSLEIEAGEELGGEVDVAGETTLQFGLLDMD